MQAAAAPPARPVPQESCRPAIPGFLRGVVVLYSLCIVGSILTSLIAVFTPHWREGGSNFLYIVSVPSSSEGYCNNHAGLLSSCNELFCGNDSCNRIGTIVLIFLSLAVKLAALNMVVVSMRSTNNHRGFGFSVPVWTIFSTGMLGIALGLFSSDYGDYLVNASPGYSYFLALSASLLSGCANVLSFIFCCFFYNFRRACDTPPVCYVPHNQTVYIVQQGPDASQPHVYYQQQPQQPQFAYGPSPYPQGQTGNPMYPPYPMYTQPNQNPTAPPPSYPEVSQNAPQFAKPTI